MPGVRMHVALQGTVLDTVVGLCMHQLGSVVVVVVLLLLLLLVLVKCACDQVN